jgi:hypothetical protein
MNLFTLQLQLQIALNFEKQSHGTRGESHETQV